MKSFYKANWRELNSMVGQCVELPEAKKRTPKMQDIIELDEALLLCIKNLAKLDTPQTETKITNKDYKILVANELTNKNEA